MYIGTHGIDNRHYMTVKVFPFDKGNICQGIGVLDEHVELPDPNEYHYLQAWLVSALQRMIEVLGDDAVANGAAEIANLTLIPVKRK